MAVQGFACTIQHNQWLDVTTHIGLFLQHVNLILPRVTTLVSMGSFKVVRCRGKSYYVNSEDESKLFLIQCFSSRYPSHCITANFPNNYTAHMCTPSDTVYITSFNVSWSYTGMSTVVHLPRWRGDDGELSYGTVIPVGAVTPTGTFTGGSELDVYCCDDETGSTSTTSSTLLHHPLSCLLPRVRLGVKLPVQARPDLCQAQRPAVAKI